jgi:hypothetical protein
MLDDWSDRILTGRFRKPDVPEKCRQQYVNRFFEMADRTGLEPATSAVTGRHSNRLNYRSAEGLHPASMASWLSLLPVALATRWWVVQGSNL